MPSSSSKKSVTSVASLSGESWREARDVPPFALRAAAGPVGRDLGALFLGAGSASVLSASAAPAALRFAGGSVPTIFAALAAASSPAFCFLAGAVIHEGSCRTLGFGGLAASVAAAPPAAGDGAGRNRDASLASSLVAAA